MVSIIPVSALTWATETVDSGFNYGAGSSLKLDNAGNPHISYMQISGGSCSYPNYCLKYAKKGGTSWTKTTIDSPVGSTGGMYDAGTSLVLDSGGNPHFSYYNQTSGDLRYLNGKLWTKMAADPNIPYYGWQERGKYSSIAMDSSNYPHIAYYVYDGGHPKLKYASWTGASWSNETLPDDTDMHVGNYNSLALDSSDVAHISTTNVSGGLYYVTWNGATWTTKIIDDTCSIGQSSLTLNSAGNPRISYYDSTNHRLKYAEKNSGSWTTGFVTTTSGTGEFNSLALDSAGNPHISYYNSSSQSLEYASKAGSSWTIETVDDSSSYMGYCNSLELDSSDRPHISYWDYGTGSLKYAVGTPAGTTEVGVYRPSTHTFYLRPSDWPTTPTRQINWGVSTDLPVTGDWDGDGAMDVGVFRESSHTFILRPGDWPATPSIKIPWGKSDDLPVTGDWDGDGTTEVGVFRPSEHTFLLRPADWPATSTIKINWGTSTDLPVTGDWDGDGTTEVGVFRPSEHTFLLRPADWPATSTIKINWGTSTDLPVTGDWDGDGTMEVGTYRQSMNSFSLRPADWPTTPTIKIIWGANTDLPVTGNW